MFKQLLPYFWFSSHCLRAAAFYIRGLLSFFQGRYNEAKYEKPLKEITWTNLRCHHMNLKRHWHVLLCCRRFLRETLKMSNAEDLNRLTACSLVLLGHIFYVLGNHRVRLYTTGFPCVQKMWLHSTYLIQHFHFDPFIFTITYTTCTKSRPVKGGKKKIEQYMEMVLLYRPFLKRKRTFYVKYNFK